MRSHPYPKAPFVLQHGGRHGSWSWDRFKSPLLAALKDASTEIITPDVPGCGLKRARNTSGLTLRDVASELNAELAERHLPPAVLVAHSMAGVLVPHLLAQRADLYEQVVLVSAFLPAQGQSVRDLMGMGQQGSDPATVGWPVGEGADEPNAVRHKVFTAGMDEASASWVAREASQDRWPNTAPFEPTDLSGLAANTPVSYVLTTRDPILPEHWQRAVAERAGAGERVFPIDTPHAPYITHPRLLAETVSTAVETARQVQP